jgi:hypothetical protein
MTPTAGNKIRAASDMGPLAVKWRTITFISRPSMKAVKSTQLPHPSMIDKVIRTKRVREFGCSFALGSIDDVFQM